MTYGIVIVSHSPEIASGLKKLIREVAKNISLTAIGGLENGEIGTSFDRVMNAIEENEADNLLTFFDLGSARMNLDLVSEMTDKELTIFNVPLIEGAYTEDEDQRWGSSGAILEAGCHPSPLSLF